MDNNYDNNYGAPFEGGYGETPQKPFNEKSGTEDAARTEPSAPSETYDYGTPAPSAPSETYDYGTPAPSAPSETCDYGTPAPSAPSQPYDYGTPAPSAPSQPYDYGTPAQRVYPPVQPQQPVQPAPNEQEPAPFRPQQYPNAYDFRPEKPLMKPQEPQTAPRSAAQGEPFDPVEHTAVYQNGSFVSPQQELTTQPQGYYQQPKQPVYDANPYERPQTPFNNPYAAPSAQAFGGAQPPKKKANKGLVIVIIVLSVLLAGSLAGILVLALNSSSRGGIKDDNVSNGFNVPEHDFTFPDSFGELFPQETQPATEEHKESDYSSKTISDYSGLTLEKKPDDAEDNKQYKSDYAFEKVSESVVGVMCYTDKDKSKLDSQGSGIIFTADGYVVTNSHVVGNSKTLYAITVVTSDGKEYNAGVVGYDQRTDIAVLKMDDAKDLKAATFGDSSEITVGEDIIIVGNPGGISYQNSMTKGIVSAVDRDASSRSITKYIQTDAAINPGNSGGPAVNMYGQVIGIASAKIASVSYEGMCFAIPSQTAKTIVDSLMKNGYVTGRVKIGVSGVAVTAEDAANYNLPQGILVESVLPDGPCAETGLAQNDVIVGLDGEKVTSFAEIYNILEKHKEGDKVTLKYWQASSEKEVEEEITLAADE